MNIGITAAMDKRRKKVSDDAPAMDIEFFNRLSVKAWQAAQPACIRRPGSGRPFPDIRVREPLAVYRR